MAQDRFANLMRAGEEAAGRGAWADAAKRFEEAAAQQPMSADAHRNLAVARHAMGALAEAETACRRSLELDPAATITVFNLACILLAKQAFAEAERYFREVLSRQPGHVRAAFNLGGLAQMRRDDEAARAFYETVVAAEPAHAGAAFYLMELQVQEGRYAEAAARGQFTLDRLASAPMAQRRPLLLQKAEAHKKAGELAEARRCYEAVIVEEPQNNYVRHLLAGATHELTHAYARDYARAEFDQLAPTFDHHLLQVLNYRAPELLAAGLRRHWPRGDAFADVLDLGCGTGLVGVNLAAHYQVKTLAGVDLSERMISQARLRCLYTSLACAELLDFMQRGGRYDLVTAADVFIYVGDLRRVILAAVGVLKPSGVLAFSIEVSPDAEVELRPSGRYRQSLAHVRGAARDSGLEVREMSEGPIRLEGRRDVMGMYVYLTKPQAGTT